MFKGRFSKKKKDSNSVQLGKPRFRVSRQNKRVSSKPKSRGGLMKSFFSFKKVKGSNVRAKKAKRSQILNISIRYSLVLFALLLLGAISYRGISWAVETRTSKFLTDSGVYGTVYGFDDLPQFPRSDSILEDERLEDSSIVKEFKASGRSVYRLRRNAKIDDVFTFYKEQLEDTEWEHVNSISRTSNEGLYGEYWVNRDKDYGVRIYDRVNDIWFEKVAVADAESGLSAVLGQIVERELIISSSSGTNLLPDFQWEISIPREYIVSYFATDKGTLRGVTFKELAGSNIYSLEPVWELDGTPFDKHLERYVDILNTRNKANENPSVWRISDSRYQEIGPRNVLVGTVVSEGEFSKVYILPNTRSNHSYALFQHNSEDAFSNYLLRNIQDKSSTYSSEAFEL